MALTAVTMYPDKEEKREQLLIAITAKVLVMGAQAQSKPQVEIDTRWLDLLLKSPPVDKIVSDAASYAAHSWIAGEVILFMINAAIHHPELNVTLTKAVWALPRLLGGEETWNGGAVSVGQRTVWKAWSRFKSVAHLHAVRQIWLQDRTREIGPDIEGFVNLHNDKILEYLSISEAIRKAAVERRILRHDDTWRPPEGLELPPARIEIPKLPQSAIEELGRYRPEYSKDSEGEDA
jgi:hypothetical protein